MFILCIAKDFAIYIYTPTYKRETLSAEKWN